MKKLTIATILSLALTSNVAFADGGKQPDPNKKQSVQSDDHTDINIMDFFRQFLKF